VDGVVGGVGDRAAPPFLLELLGGRRVRVTTAAGAGDLVASAGSSRATNGVGPPEDPVLERVSPCPTSIVRFERCRLVFGSSLTKQMRLASTKPAGV
jgi:hypothetical protein